MTVNVWATARVGEEVSTQEAKCEARDETARENSKGLAVSQHSGTVHGSEQKEC